MEDYRTPCSIGDSVYIINNHLNRGIEKVVVDGFIIDEIGVHPAEMTHDGWQVIGFYCDHEVIYYTLEKAEEGLRKLAERGEA